MGPPENRTSPAERQEVGRRLVRRPRMRRCLLKGCEQRFRPRQARQRYCGERCRGVARKWSRWKAQHAYRTTAAGKRKRNGQSLRYRVAVTPSLWQRMPRWTRGGDDAVARRNAETAERALLYVALTRSKKSATVTAYGELSPFLKPSGLTTSRRKIPNRGEKRVSAVRGRTRGLA
jgi:hypothetical protein